jgi:hypothetical protein
MEGFTWSAQRFNTNKLIGRFNIFLRIKEKCSKLGMESARFLEIKMYIDQNEIKSAFPFTMLLKFNRSWISQCKSRISLGPPLTHTQTHTIQFTKGGILWDSNNNGGKWRNYLPTILNICGREIFRSWNTKQPTRLLSSGCNCEIETQTTKYCYGSNSSPDYHKQAKYSEETSINVQSLSHKGSINNCTN